MRACARTWRPALGDSIWRSLSTSSYSCSSSFPTASAAEAVGKLDEQEYELVLSDLQMESPRAGLQVLAHARMMDYKPATAIVTTYQNAKPQITKPQKSRMLI